MWSEVTPFVPSTHSLLIQFEGISENLLKNKYI